MKLEVINNKSIMNVGLININYNKEIQLEQIEPFADTLIYFDNNDLDNILDYVRENDTLIILSYSFVNDETLKALNFKAELDKKNIKINSVMEKVNSDSKTNDLIFNLSVGLYEAAKFIMKNRII